MNFRQLLVAVGAAMLLAGGARAQGYYEQPPQYEEPREQSYGRDYGPPRHEPREYRREERVRNFPHQLEGLHAGCERGDRAACVRLGWVLRENRGRREQWRRQRPEYYWWDR